MHRSKETIWQQLWAASGTSHVVPTELPMLQSLNIADNRKKKSKKFTKVRDENPDKKAKKEHNPMIPAGNPIVESNFDDSLHNIYLQITQYNLAVIHELSQSLAKADVSNAVILNSKFKHS